MMKIYKKEKSIVFVQQPTPTQVLFHFFRLALPLSMKNEARFNERVLNHDRRETKQRIKLQLMKSSCIKLYFDALFID